MGLLDVIPKTVTAAVKAAVPPVPPTLEELGQAEPMGAQVKMGGPGGSNLSQSVPIPAAGTDAGTLEMSLAAAAVGLALVLILYRRRK